VQAAFVSVELPLMLILIGTLTFRQRTADALATNPLDPAAQFRIICVGLAGLLGLIALISPSRATDGREKLATMPFNLYAVYVVVALLGIMTSSKPLLTAYRVIELVAVLIAVGGAMRAVGLGALPRMKSVLYGFIVAMVVSVWIGVALAPARAIEQITAGGTPWPWAIQGALPLVSSNGVGLLGVTLAFWSLGRASDRQRRGERATVSSYVLALLGVVTTIAAQYRTGYVALVVGLFVFLIVRRKMIVLMLLAIAVATVLVWAPSLVSSAQPVALRGQSPTEARGLSGRVDFWTHAVPVWEESPWIGKGLITATRFEVLAPLGYTLTAGIHSTWVEALVGTGVLGLGFLAVSFLVTAGRAVGELWKPRGSIIPLLLITVLGVHTITGNSFEALDWTMLVFIWLALSCGRSTETASTSDR